MVSSHASGRRVDAHAYEPPEDLADIVASLWTGRWDLRGQPPHVTELLGDPCVHVVFEDGGPHPGSRIVGVWTRLWCRTLEDRGRVYGVKLHAGACRSLLADPAFRFSNKIVPLAQVFGDEAHNLEGRVLAARTDEAAFEIVTAWLRARRRDEDRAATRMAVALVERVVRDPEITTVEGLASIAGIGPRALQRLFREHVGASPKWVIRRNRLQEAVVRIERGANTTLADLAAELGYADQAHFARDFKHAVGMSPSAFGAKVCAGLGFASSPREPENLGREQP